MTRQSILQRMRCLRYDGDLRSVDGYIRKIWGDDRPFWNIRADISRSRLALSGQYFSSEQSSREHIHLRIIKKGALLFHICKFPQSAQKIENIAFSKRFSFAVICCGEVG